eukprot:TRINITY_DN8434_c0_g1_i2.p1 TRINITY_DN8434_c0_g1~~TRINITY_DN8434_c0_g1_i2.p1  ORF type:complete len:436 (+),score=36.28 TRINITY_DN8434_c0_g1_i2:14-1321(+)
MRIGNRFSIAWLLIHIIVASTATSTMTLPDGTTCNTIAIFGYEANTKVLNTNVTLIAYDQSLTDTDLFGKAVWSNFNPLYLERSFFLELSKKGVSMIINAEPLYLFPGRNYYAFNWFYHSDDTLMLDTDHTCFKTILDLLELEKTLNVAMSVNFSDTNVHKAVYDTAIIFQIVFGISYAIATIILTICLFLSVDKAKRDYGKNGVMALVIPIILCCEVFACLVLAITWNIDPYPYGAYGKFPPMLEVFLGSAFLPPSTGSSKILARRKIKKKKNKFKMLVLPFVIVLIVLMIFTVANMFLRKVSPIIPQIFSLVYYLLTFVNVVLSIYVLLLIVIYERGNPETKLSSKLQKTKITVFTKVMIMLVQLTVLTMMVVGMLKYTEAAFFIFIPFSCAQLLRAIVSMLLFFPILRKPYNAGSTAYSSTARGTNPKRYSS